ncbi:MAG TPA: hypothetical protein VF299_05785 [Mycobacterium sp.]
MSATWKIVTLGTALTGLGIAGAAAATANAVASPEAGLPALAAPESDFTGSQAVADAPVGPGTGSVLPLGWGHGNWGSWGGGHWGSWG